MLFKQHTHHIQFDDPLLRVQTTLGPWPARSGPALAGVSSFGFGGTNAHVVLEEAPPSDLGMQNGEWKISNPESAHLLPLSARSPAALHSLVRTYQNSLAAPESTVSLDDICYSASVRRSQHD